MEIGVYFPQRSEYQSLYFLYGITYGVRPVLNKATDPSTDAGFVSSPVIEKTNDPTYLEKYGADEADDPAHPERITGSPPGSFVAISNGGYGFNASMIPPFLHRGVENYTGEILPDILSIPRSIFTYFNCRKKWGTDWTPIIWGKAPAWWLRFQLWAYKKAGVKRVFFWRWDYNKEWIQKVLPHPE